MDNNESKNIVAKHNELIESKYKLNVNQQRLILSLIAKIHPKEEKFQRYDFKISDLCRMLKLNKESHKMRQKRFVSILNELQRTLINISFLEDGRKKFATPAWIEEPIFDWEKDQITLRIAETLKPYLLQLQNKGDFTTYRLKDIGKFRCEYSFRFLELCKNLEPRADFHDLIINNRYVKKDVPQLAELRAILGIAPKLYSRPYDFKKKVLLPAQKEVNQYTSSYFEFKMLKTGRQVTGVEFWIFGPAIAVQKITLNQTQQAQQKRLLKTGCSIAFSTRFLVEYSHKENQVWQAVMAMEEYVEWLKSKGAKLKFPASALKKALFEGWHSKLWQKQQEEELKEAQQIADEKERQDLQKALKKLQARRKAAEKAQEEEWEYEQERQTEKWNQQMETWGAEFDRLELDKRAAFVLGVLPRDDWESLKKEERKKIETIIEKFVNNSEHDFKELHHAVFQMMLEFMLPFASKSNQEK